MRLCTRLHRALRPENGAAGTGGKNAKQIGLGVKSGATAVNITGAGSAETTGNPFDLRLNDKNATNFFCGK